MKRTDILLGTLCIFMFLMSPAMFDCTAQGAESFTTLQKRLGGGFDDKKMEAGTTWDAFEEAQKREWAGLKQEVERQWQTFVRSTRREWVDYNDWRDTRSKVDFKDGIIEIETVIPEGDPKALDVAQEKISAQATQVFQKETVNNETVLDSQVRDKNGAVVTVAAVPRFITSEILPDIRPDPQPYLSSDGRKRRRYSVQINLVPEHLDIRSRRYLPLVEQNAQRFHLEPHLLMAIIHTESYFNPLAISDSGAIGLMQIIPRYGGRDAYRHLYDEDWIILPEYLYAPGINVELGSAYVYLLQRRYFSDIQDPEQNRYVSICAYNWGPTAVRKKILDSHPVKGMSDPALFSLLKKETPAETSDYLTKVTERMPLYEGYFR